MHSYGWTLVHYKVKDQGKTRSRAVYNILGINKEGKKDLLGVYVSESEGANFWLSVLTDLQNRGVKDMLIACIDNSMGSFRRLKYRVV